MKLYLAGTKSRDWILYATLLGKPSYPDPVLMEEREMAAVI